MEYIKHTRHDLTGVVVSNKDKQMQIRMQRNKETKK